MARREEYEQKTEALLQPVMEENGFELVDVEYVKEGSSKYLRAYIDKPGGITIDDCEKVSRRLSDLLDEKDFIDEAYILEVSSPGLGRPLKKEKDFARSVGSEVEVRCFRPVNHEKEFTGVLKAYDRDTVTLAIREDEDLTLERANLALIRLAFDF
ncbi:MAG: ribosome maturation factor RimP [Lachnospiraceae bacterium]|nr:ribosome maturation factor RimP [Lachnospiraceae bacterium]